MLLNSSSVAQKRHADDYETRPAKRAKIGSTSYTTTDSAPSSELALDNLFDLLLDQKDNPLWQRNIQHVVDSALDHDAIFNTIASPLNKVLQAVERRNTDNSAAERDILTTVGNQFIAQVLQHLVDGLHDHDVDLRINPSLNWRGIDGDIHATFGAHGAGPSDEGREASPEVRILRDDYGESKGPGRGVLAEIRHTCHTVEARPSPPRFTCP